MVRVNDALPFPLAAAVGRVLGFALLTISLSACTTLRVGSDFEHSASFTEYHAFSLIPRERRGSENPLVVQRAHDAIQAALTEKGFVYVNDPATADFMVDFTIGSRVRVDVSSYPSPYVGWYDGYAGWWGTRTGVLVSTCVSTARERWRLTYLTLVATSLSGMGGQRRS